MNQPKHDLPPKIYVTSEFFLSFHENLTGENFPKTSNGSKDFWWILFTDAVIQVIVNKFKVSWTEDLLPLRSEVNICLLHDKIYMMLHMWPCIKQKSANSNPQLVS